MILTGPFCFPLDRRQLDKLRDARSLIGRVDCTAIIYQREKSRFRKKHRDRAQLSGLIGGTVAWTARYRVANQRNTAVSLARMFRVREHARTKTDVPYADKTYDLRELT